MKKQKCIVKKHGNGYATFYCNGERAGGYSPKKGFWGATKNFKKFEKLMKKEKK